jgi:hypothetical protein
MPREPAWWGALALCALVCLPLAFAKKWLPKVGREFLAVVASVSLVILMVFCLNPPVARVERLHCRGRDHFTWGARLRSPVPQERQEAARALAALLNSSKSTMRLLVLQYLGDCRPEERDIALAALLALARDEGEDEFLRSKAEYALGVMFFQHVAGDLGPWSDREPYQKLIVAQGWDAAEREFARRKRAQAQKQ